MKKIEDIKEFKDIDTYYEISKIVEEVFQDRVEAHKHLVTANKEIEKLQNQLQQKENIIKEVREKINNYTTRMEVLNYQISDLTKKELLEILDKVKEI